MEQTLSRRAFLGTLAAGAMACAGADAAAAARRPNFVVMLADDLGYGDLGCFGHPRIRTPNLDRLANQGVRLTDCYASAPVCSPSRSGMLTGRTPNRLGVYDWIPNGSPMHLRRSELTIASILQAAGYATCHVGKWHCNGKFNSREQPQPGDHGFEHWFSTQNNAGPSHRNPVNFVRNGQRVGPLEGYSSQLIVDEALSWLNGRKDGNQPFCLFVWFHATHEPVATGEPFVKMYPSAATPQQADYFGNVTQMDHEIGRLLSHLDEAKHRENTFVMFTSDNGPETLNRYRNADRSYGSPGPLRGMKLHLYEGGIRVPGIIRMPGLTRAGQVCSEPVNGTDVLPTLCALAGVKAPTDRVIDGANIAPALSGGTVERAVPLYWQYNQAIGRPKVAMRQGDWKLLAGIGGQGNPAGFELYNLREDLGETRDVYQTEPVRAAAMRRELMGLFEQVRKEGPQWPAG